MKLFGASGGVKQAKFCRYVGRLWVGTCRSVVNPFSDGLTIAVEFGVKRIGVYLGFGAEANFVNSRFPVQLSSSLLTKGQMRNGGPKKYSESRKVYKK